MIINKEIRERFDLLLHTLGITQGQLSLKMGFSNGNGLSMITRGKSELNERHLIILENTINVNRDWLINGNGTMFKDENGKETKTKPEINSIINSKLSNEMTNELIKQMMDTISRQQNTMDTLISKLPDYYRKESDKSDSPGEAVRKAAGDR